MEKILVACPISYHSKYCLGKFIEGVKSIDYYNYDILLVDNSRENDFFEELIKIKNIKVVRDDSPEQKNIFRLISSRNKIIEYALKNDYDYIFMIDSDVIPPKNILNKLIESDKEIISGLYYNYFTINEQIKWRPVCWRHITPEEFTDISQKIKFPPIVKSHKDIRRHLTKEEAQSEKVFCVKVPSAGCMLIKKNVFEKIKYGQLNIDGFTPKTGEDIYFFTKAEEKGFEFFCDTSLKCKHLIEGKYKKDEEGNFVHPTLY